MTQFKLFLELLEIITQLFETGANACNTYEARLLIDSLLDDFDENQGIYIEEEAETKAETAEGGESKLETIIAGIDAKMLAMPKELQDYFLMIESLQSGNYFQGLAPLPEPNTIEQAQLMVGIFTILNDLLVAGITSCHLHEAHMLLDALLYEFEQSQADIVNTVEDSAINALDHLFPNLENQLGALTIFPKSEVDFNAII